MARQAVLLVTLAVAVLLPLATGTSDWMQSCGSCHCHWNSGKKSADCKNKALTKIPLDMSNEMQVLDFAHNQIPELRREEFLLAGLPNVHKVYLRNCTIQEVHREAFKGLHILIELDMSGNRIRELHPGTFAGLEKLRNVIINNNEIEVLPNHLFVNLSYLSRIEFRNNRLRQVQLHVFAGTVALSAISLEQNRLSHLHKETFKDLQKLMHLSLQGNAWNCSCELQDFRDFAINKRLYTPPTDCQEPPQLRGKLWSEVPSENFACRPRILGSVRSFVEANHDNISLPCRIVGSPRPNVTWVYNKRPLQTYDPRVRVLNSIEQLPPSQQPAQVLTSELRIVGVRPSDKGAYTCVADNRGGRAEAEFQLIVSGDYAGAVSTSNGMGGLGGLGMGAIGAPAIDPQTNVFLIICLITTTLLLLLIVVVLTLFWYCRRIKTYQKDTTMMSGDGLISSKMDKTHNGSMLEGSVIMEMQKSLLNEVNPVEKPPRRTDIESVDGGDDVLEIKKTLLDDTVYVPNHSRDEEAHSVALSDTTTTPRSRHTYVDDAYANSLPPDLLAFPARVPPTSPSMQSSQSNIPDQVIYGIRSPPSLTSPVYTHMTPHGIYGTKTLAAPHNGFMTLQHPKSRNLALIATANSSRQHQHQHHHLQQQQQQQHHQQQHPLGATSPFLPAPVVYSPATAVVMKQGYMTIPRKPRTPSWAPSTSGGASGGGGHGAIQLSEFQSPTSPNPSETGTATTAEMQAEPVYDNLGLRTTAGGNSTLNLTKIAGGASQSGGQQQQYSMRDRPLPATPSLTSVSSATNASKIYEPIHELIQQQQQQQQQQQLQQQQLQQQQQQQQRLGSMDTEPLYGVRHQGITILPGSSISGAGLGHAAYISPVPSTVSPSHAHAGSGSGESPKTAKIPPRPPPKPKKKMSVTTTRSGQGSTSQLFDDEGEDGTEV
ncbi:uncharacterized protein LOC108134829 [Drosophila elegans]|uniref:uncharacterized protein LOC108134829 n=1 Tax=Drosophila elegans TaxID=30023 RepID=UPI0007E7446D|nr:uncharacterized protein LOC108134829 [Drosophila elegans]XP_041563083.1 uncharacterized protein LOC108134829 [Drosophila elegans]